MWSPGLNSPSSSFMRERVEQMFLDGAFQRAGAELRIVAFLREELLGVLVELQA